MHIYAYILNMFKCDKKCNKKNPKSLPKSTNDGRNEVKLSDCCFRVLERPNEINPSMSGYFQKTMKYPTAPF